MNVTHLIHTDIAFLQFSNQHVSETREINETLFVDLDREDNLPSMTTEHAKQSISLPGVSAYAVLNCQKV